MPAGFHRLNIEKVDALLRERVLDPWEVERKARMGPGAIARIRAQGGRCTARSVRKLARALGLKPQDLTT